MTFLHKYLLLWLAALISATAIGCTTPGTAPSMANGESETADSRELPPKDAARACMAAAEELQKGGQVEPAIALFEKARRNDPGLKTVAHRLAALYDAKGDGPRSLAEYKLAIEAEPKNADVYSDLGYYYLKRQNLSDAEQQLRKALEIDPKHAKALTNLGLVLAAQQRFDESFQAFALAVGPAAAHSNVGVLLAKQGRIDEARRHFHDALALDATLKQPQAFSEYLDRSR